MPIREVFQIILLLLLIVCAISVNLTKRLLPAIVIFMSYSSIMAVIWAMTESPDLAITEAAVGAGVSSILFFLTLKKLREEDRGEDETIHRIAEPSPDLSPDRDEEGGL